MEHLKGTVPAYVFARMKRLQGYTGINPKDFVDNEMKNAIEQSRKIGLSFDYDRSFCIIAEDYYNRCNGFFFSF